MGKLKIGIYWAASCGGCDVAIVDIHEHVLELVAAADILFWPCAMDFKYRDVEAMPDKHLDAVFFTGAIRNSENEHLAKLLRAKSKVLIAFGACAHLGGIPGLANFTTRAAIMQTVYKDCPSVDNPDGVLPRTSVQVPEGELTIPTLYNRVRSLGQTVPVDYYVPGCPPDPAQIWAVITALASGKLPARGSVVGCSDKAMCEECKRKKTELKIKEFKRRHLTHVDPEVCLMEQGVLCMGAATRAGCGWRCINANMPCRGCYGPLPGVADHGSKILSAISACIDSTDEAEIEKILAGLPDPAGYFYRFALPTSMMGGRKEVAP
jgi:F420-non-reducing hydrogenase small subunit